MTVGERFDARANSLNLIRLILAVLVLISHAWPVGGYGDDPQLGDMNLGTWAVAGFFAISGYLITGSRENSSSFWSFIQRRARRIFPAYLVCLLVVAFGFAPLSVALGGSGPWVASDAITYIVKNLALWPFQTGVDATLRGVPYPEMWNGPLWTLSYEFLYYVAVGVLVGIAPKRWRGRVLLALGGLLAVTMLGHVFLDVGTNGPAIRAVRLGGFFISGALMWEYRHRLPSRASWAVACAGVLAFLGAVGAAQAVGGVFVAYVIMYIGSTFRTKVGSRNDISYGVYIYAWPVQQLFSTVFGDRGVPIIADIVVVLAVTLILASGSWFGLERWFIRSRRSPRLPVTDLKTSPSS